MEMIIAQYFSQNSYIKGNLEELGVGGSVWLNFFLKQSTIGENVLLLGATLLLPNVT